MKVEVRTFVFLETKVDTITLISTVLASIKTANQLFSLCLGCPPLAGSIDNGYKHGSGSVEGSLAWFSCKDGYSLMGNKYLYCNEKGHWNGTTPSCLKGTVNPRRFSLLVHHFFSF